MATKKVTAASIARANVAKKPATPFVSTDPRVIVARQDARLVAAAGIVNGMTQEQCDERILAVLDSKA